jgi:hypothetical protein
VVRDNFAYANGDLFAEASGQNRYRRVTPAELQNHFKTPGSEKDKPAHWYEAQLIHYGLQPSKTKSVVRMRLFDAVNGGKLNVPAHITKMESELKKEWAKKEREAKKEAKAQETTAKGTKRKAIDLKVSVGGINIGLSASSTSGQTTIKKAKTTATAKKPSGTTKDTKPAPQAVSSSELNSSSPPRTKQTARRGRGGHSYGPPRISAGLDPSPPSQPMPRQTAWRSNAFSSRGRIRAAPSSGTELGYGDEYDDYDDDDDDEDDEPPPPYSERDGYSDNYSSDGDDDSALPPLGLLNGRYAIAAPEVNDQWPDQYGSDPDDADFSLVLTLAGTRLWGRFDLGVYEGVFLLDEDRPFRASRARLDFTWRGREDNGPILYGNTNAGWIRFLGGGRVEGAIDAQGIKFHGCRLQNQGTRSEIDARTMEDEWDSYSEREYERENRSRRSGSSRWVVKRHRCRCCWRIWLYLRMIW